MVEYQVVWKRECQPRRRKIYQTRQGAENFLRSVLLSSDRDEPPEEEPSWMRQDWERMTAPFTEGPTLESREVGGWGVVAT